MKRLLKILAFLLIAPVLLLIAALLVVAGAYYNVVRQTPGGLKPPVPPATYGAQVNLFSGTGGIPYVCPYNTPGATTPFGMLRLAPDTASLITGWTGLNAAGYYYGDNKIIGFSHTRLVGADALEGGQFRIFPATATRAARARARDRGTRFNHHDETAVPGYYAVRLPAEGVLAELTATPRVGVHRYTFEKDEAPHLILDVTSALGDAHCEDGLLSIRPQTSEITGSTRAYGTFSRRYGGLDVFFAARFSRPIAAWNLWGDTIAPDSRSASGANAGVDLAFENGPGPDRIEVRLAISYTSIENAWLNLEAEAAGRPFDALAAAARDSWEERLSRIRVEGGAETQRRIFYIALYRAFHMPTLFSDANGDYIGFDNAIHKATDFRYYTDFSLWDTFRTVHPLFNLIARDDQRDMMSSLVEMARAGGALPRWPAGRNYTGCMLGSPADIALTEAYLKGIRGFDVETAYASMRRTALEGVPPTCRFGGRDGRDAYLELGYCDADRMHEAVSCTLEYAWADHAISLLARELGRAEDAERFARSARNYRNLWNPDTLYFQPRNARGEFSADFKPLLLTYMDFDGKYTNDYVEGSALQWRWAVPHDPEGLIALFPDRETFVRELDAFFNNVTAKMGAWNPGPYYWHGNEPGLHTAYLFNAAGRPDLTQKWVRWILDTRYADNYVGLDGNDDAGTLSAWYVFSALGFYPIAGTTRYELGAPLFERAEVDLGAGVLTITAGNARPENLYVQRVFWNGAPLDRTWIAHDEIAGGGTLHFEMGAVPPPR